MDFWVKGDRGLKFLKILDNEVHTYNFAKSWCKVLTMGENRHTEFCVADVD
jgi:hypothetical protein